MNKADERVSFWRRHWVAWAASGLSQRAYCAEHGLSYAAFGYWRKRAKTLTDEAPPVATFIPVVIEPPARQAPVPPSAPDGGSGVEIRLAHGRTFVVSAGFDEAVLARVIQVLEQGPC